MSEIVWEEPPRPYIHAPAVSPWNDVADRLREHPGQWARIATFTTQGAAASLASRFRKGKLPATRPAGSFEAVSRSLSSEGGGYAVYARYVGEGASS